ncbi:MAG: putative sugar nucleotidyl transferase [Gemmatimonadota bacterium]|nr:putative sugar nucleotidyl transferase [Gemmatimonadota bacterium]
MTDGPLFLFDDAIADAWAPFALTRPIGELVFGRWSARERLERAWGGRVRGHVIRPWLARFSEGGAPRAIGADDLPEGPLTLWSSRAVPAASTPRPGGPANLWLADRLAGVRLGPGAEPPDRAWLAAPSPRPDLPDETVSGEWLERPWDLVARGPERLAADLGRSVGTSGSPVPDGCLKLGDGPLETGEGTRIEPGVLFDARDGPIVLDRNVEVRAGTRLAGPLYAGPASRLLGGSIQALSAGPRSYVRGEIEKVTMLGWANKAHDGFLGHAYVGRWVNLGAMTTNSDLKNNYGTIRMGPPDAAVDTGLVKLGCLLGDHVKTGIGVLLTTGAVIGAGSNLFGSELAPRWVEPFSWGRGEDLVHYRRDAFLATAARVVARRGVDADEALLGWLGDVWDRARGDG